MIHSDIFERFVEDAPVCVMVQALMENALSPTTVDALFEPTPSCNTRGSSCSRTSSA